MTIHCAISYFEENSGGYLLGCDSTLQRVRTNGSSIEVVDSISVDKSFRGACSLGFVRGAGRPKTSEPLGTQFAAAMRSLDFRFDSIRPGEVYNDLPSLLQEYVLLIAKQQAERLELFTVSNQRKKKEHNHRARLLHQLEQTTLSAERASVVFYAPCTPHYFQMKFEERCGFVRAKKILEQLLTERSVINTNPQQPIYDPGKASLFAVDFTGIRQIA